jgi:hypothetical protein
MYALEFDLHWWIYPLPFVYIYYVFIPLGEYCIEFHNLRLARFQAFMAIIDCEQH